MEIDKSEVGGAVVPLLTEIGQLRERYIDLSKALGEAFANLLAESYALCALAAQDSGVAKAVVEEIRRLRGKFDSRNGVERCAVLIAFHGELPTTRTKYVNALRDGRQTGMSVEEFRETVSRGSSTNAGIKQLTAVVKKRASPTTPGRGSRQLTPPPLGRREGLSFPNRELAQTTAPSKKASDKPAEARLTFGRRAREKVVELDPEPGEKVRCIIKNKGGGRWRVVAVRGLVRTRPRRHRRTRGD